MFAHELEELLLEELDLAGRPELAVESNIPWSSGRAIPDITAALLLKNVPIVYFSRLSDLDQDRIQTLHRNVWSQSKTPLLFVTLPHEIRIYNCYEPPPPDDTLDTGSRLLQHLTALTDSQAARHAIRKLIETNHYERIYLETGAFWNTQEGQRIDAKRRADRQLVEAMAQMRSLLTSGGLSNQTAYSLLGRSIFIRYLEDRGILGPKRVRQMTEERADSYLQALSEGLHPTYSLFHHLSRRFNGDLFPVEDAERSVTEDHIELLFNFLSGTNLETGQLSLWPYNFEYIPIELVSHIYDTFIGDQRSSGAYYTPLPLADFILEETMGEALISPDMNVLDPACGSGIFLVGAYRRLIRAWSQLNGSPDPDVLNRLLQTQIFGVDRNPEAIRIAAFSLYLELLNHLTNDQILDQSFRFPVLEGDNLLHSDFFAEDVDEHFKDSNFDRIVGNMPWGKGTLTSTADDWLQERDYVVGGRQAAPAFMLRVPEFCKDDGEIALLAAAKSTFLVTSEPHQEFREYFLRNYQIRAVVNFSALVYELFPEAISPAVAVFFTQNAPSGDDKLVYGVPKPSPLSRKLQTIILDATEVKFLPQKELLIQPHLWKVAQWGTPRDAALIDRLKTIPSLKEQAESLEWLIGEGIQIGGGDENSAPWLEGIPLVPTDKLRPYFIDKSVLEPISERVFHRPRTRELTEAPLVLIHQSQCSATYSDIDVAYRHAITGVTGRVQQQRLLYWLVAYINSPLAKYYHFLTSTRWAVERGNIIQWEYENMPFHIPDKNDPRLLAILRHMEQLQELQDSRELLASADHEARQRQHEKAINRLVYELYDLHPVEQQLVEDMLQYGVKFFEWAKRKSRKAREAEPVKTPNPEMLRAYAEVFSRTAASLLRVNERTLNGTIYQNGAPLTVMSFDLVNIDQARPVRIEGQPASMRNKLRELDSMLLARQTPSLYIRRHVRIYDGNQISLIRPSERRFWTRSQARADADEFLAELQSEEQIS